MTDSEKSSTNNKSGASTTVVVAIIGFLGIVLAAVLPEIIRVAREDFFIAQTQTAIAINLVPITTDRLITETSTQTATATRTLTPTFAPTSSATYTAMALTDTSTPSQTRQPTQTPRPTPIARLRNDNQRSDIAIHRSPNIYSPISELRIGQIAEVLGYTIINGERSYFIERAGVRGWINSRLAPIEGNSEGIQPIPQPLPTGSIPQDNRETH